MCEPTKTNIIRFNSLDQTSYLSFYLPLFIKHYKVMRVGNFLVDIAHGEVNNIAKVADLCTR